MEQLALFALPLNQDGEELEDGSSDASAYIYINLRRQPDREDNFEHDSHSERAGVMHSDMREDDNSELHPNNPPSELDQQESQGLQISSYWSVPEQTDFPKLLSQFGTDWHGIAKHMTTKTHIMVYRTVFYHISWACVIARINLSLTCRYRLRTTTCAKWDRIKQPSGRQLRKLRTKGNLGENPPITHLRNRLQANAKMQIMD